MLDHKVRRRLAVTALAIALVAGANAARVVFDVYTHNHLSSFQYMLYATNVTHDAWYDGSMGITADDLSKCAPIIDTAYRQCIVAGLKFESAMYELFLESLLLSLLFFGLGFYLFPRPFKPAQESTDPN